VCAAGGFLHSQTGCCHIYYYLLLSIIIYYYLLLSIIIYYYLLLSIIYYYLLLSLIIIIIISYYLLLSVQGCRIAQPSPCCAPGIIARGGGGGGRLRWCIFSVKFMAVNDHHLRSLYRLTRTAPIVDLHSVSVLEIHVFFLYPHFYGKYTTRIHSGLEDHQYF